MKWLLQLLLNLLPKLVHELFEHYGKKGIHIDKKHFDLDISIGELTLEVTEEDVVLNTETLVKLTVDRYSKSGKRLILAHNTGDRDTIKRASARIVKSLIAN